MNTEHRGLVEKNYIDNEVPRPHEKALSIRIENLTNITERESKLLMEIAQVITQIRYFEFKDDPIKANEETGLIGDFDKCLRIGNSNLSALAQILDHLNNCI